MYDHTSSDRHRLIVDNLIESVIVIVRSTRTVEDIRWSSCGRNRLSKTIDDHRTVDTDCRRFSTRHRHRAVGISRTHNANRMLPIVQIRVRNSTHSSNRKQTRFKRQFQNDGMSCITPVSSSYFRRSPCLRAHCSFLAKKTKKKKRTKWGLRDLRPSSALSHGSVSKPAMEETSFMSA